MGNSKTTTTLTVSANSVTTGTAVDLTATVKDQNNAAVAGGEIKFCDASAAYCEDTAVLGKAQLTAAGSASVNLGGSGDYASRLLRTAMVQPVRSWHGRRTL